MKKKIIAAIIFIIILIIPNLVFIGIYNYMFEDRHGNDNAEAKTLLANWIEFETDNEDVIDFTGTYVISSENKYNEKFNLSEKFEERLSKENHFDVDKCRYLLFIENGEAVGSVFSESKISPYTGSYIIILKSKDYPNGVEHGDVIKPSECNFNHQAKLLYEEFKEKHKD